MRLVVGGMFGEWTVQQVSGYGVGSGFESYPQVGAVAWCLLKIELSSVNSRNCAVTA